MNKVPRNKKTPKVIPKTPKPLSKRQALAVSVAVGVVGGILLSVHLFANSAGPLGGATVPLRIPAANIGDNDDVAHSQSSTQKETTHSPRSLRAIDVIGAEGIRLDKARIVDGKYRQTLDDGRVVTFTLNPAVQQRAQQLLEENAVPYGAVVAIDPRDGRVLALASYSSAEPNRPVAFSASQPAASVFKVVSAAALLEFGNISPDDSICYHGGRRGISEALLNPNPKLDTACNTLAEAIAESTNVVFARMADQHLDVPKLTEVAERFGFGEPVPFAWAVEPSRVSLPQKRVEFAGAAAGFHHSTLSPLHAAVMMAGIANDGEMPEPEIVESVDHGGVFTYRAERRVWKRASSAEHARKLTEMMVLTTVRGTATKYFSKRGPGLDGVTVAGKTGSLSSENGGVVRHNSWFVGFAPADKPEIAIAALVVNDPKWRIKGTLLARQVLETYFTEVRAAASVGRDPSDKVKGDRR
ncbi:MAG: penicillin-binding protein [Myxococcales bacterium]|nr:penicillin-binding protein [Myxococcales bacterium]